MKGLELSQAFFEEHGRPMLETQFPELLPFLAVGLFGSGSECFGYDDVTSQDHDFEPGFCIFLPGEDVVSRRDAFLLERAYAKLPRSFMGYKRSVLSPVGGNRHGVLRTAEFFNRTVGSVDGTLDLMQWLSLPEQALAEATNGKLFFDRYGEVSDIREKLRCFPEGIRRKRLAGHLLLMAQAGQYNYTRCLKHGETAAAQLAAVEYVKSTLSVLFLLNRRYQPYYKWVFRALRELPDGENYAKILEDLLTTGNTVTEAKQKAETIEYLSASISSMLNDQDLTARRGDDLERLAYSVNDGIRDGELRNMHVLAAV